MHLGRLATGVDHLAGGWVTETSRGNLFWRGSDGVWCTPPLDEQVLPLSLIHISEPTSGAVPDMEPAGRLRPTDVLERNPDRHDPLGVAPPGARPGCGRRR